MSQKTTHWATYRGIEDCISAIGGVVLQRFSNFIQFRYDGLPIPISIDGFNSKHGTYSYAELMLVHPVQSVKYKAQIRDAVKLTRNSFFKAFVRRNDPKRGDMMHLTMPINLDILDRDQLVERILFGIREGVNRGPEISYENVHGLSKLKQTKMVDLLRSRYDLIGDGTNFGIGGYRCARLTKGDPFEFGVDGLMQDSGIATGLRLSREVRGDYKYNLQTINELNLILETPFRQIAFIPNGERGMAMLFSIPFWRTVNPGQVLDQIDWFLSLSDAVDRTLAREDPRRLASRSSD